MSLYAAANAAENPDLLRRVAVCAAGKGVPDPTVWAARNMFALASRTDWGDRWAAAEAKLPVVDDIAGYVSPLGADTAVITDTLIKNGVTTILDVESKTATTKTEQDNRIAALEQQIAALQARQEPHQGSE